MCWKIISIRDMVPSLTIRQLKSRIEIHNFPPNQNRWRRLFVWVAGFIRWPWTEFVVLVFVAFAWVLVSLATLANVWRLVVLFRYFIVFACQIREKLCGQVETETRSQKGQNERTTHFLYCERYISTDGVFEYIMCTKRAQNEAERSNLIFFGEWKQTKKPVLRSIFSFHLLRNKHGNSRTHARRTCFSLAHT